MFGNICRARRMLSTPPSVNCWTKPAIFWTTRRPDDRVRADLNGLLSKY